MRRVVDLIAAKRDGAALSDGEISYCVDAYVSGSMPDYQMSALLMAVYWRGMTDRETFALTDSMVASGITLDLSELHGQTLDKHSTGGVGDKVSLAVVPIWAAAGIHVAKMSGRGLGNTGGTLDKLASAPGFRTEMTGQEILRQTQHVGACICAQTAEITPADKKIYALRDSTATVESIPMIAASVMSKKIAGGADALVLDVKVGRGAFTKSLEQARTLAHLMVAIGRARGKRVTAVLTDMDQPLGRSVGNRMEVHEIMDLLRGRPVEQRLRALVVEIAEQGLGLTGFGGRGLAEEMINSGKALEKFRQIIVAQGGDWDALLNDNSPAQRYDVVATKTGYVTDLDPFVVGNAAMELGAGRSRKEDTIDPFAGIWLRRIVGDYVERGDSLATLSYTRERLPIDRIARTVSEHYIIDDQKGARRPLILEFAGDVQTAAAS